MTTIEEKKKQAFARARVKNRRGLEDVAYREQEEKIQYNQQFIPEHEKQYVIEQEKEMLKDLTEKIADFLSEEHGADLKMSLFDVSMRSRLKPIIESYIKKNKIVFTTIKSEVLVERLVNEIAGLGPIDEIIKEGEGKISEIWVNGENPITQKVDIYYEKAGQKHRANGSFIDQEHAYQIARKIARNGNQSWGDTKPLANVRYPDGRVNLVRGPIATGGGGPYVSFRLFPKDTFLLDDLVHLGSINHDMKDLITLVMRYGLNGLMVGPTGSGKTTLFTASIDVIKDTDRILLMEDTEEMRLRHKYPYKHIITEETKPNSLKEDQHIDLSTLTINALRQKPDYMLYGEVRDKAAYDALNGANTGHRVWTTLHARSAARAVQRLKNMILEHGSKMDSESIGKWIAESIDIIIFQKLYPDNKRRVKEIIELVDYKNGEPIFRTLYQYIIENVHEDGSIEGRHYRIGQLSRESANYLIDEGAPFDLVKKFIQKPEQPKENTIHTMLDEYYQNDAMRY
ncbi:Flp pilus assembly complex ATPase component TadA [Alkalihalobacillus oceani]|uniref:Flp pilus assembly complex ATPase component TadA n=1 Tax=Halalkalibacter oceani TaxID=1653776 RepID=A0A9X2DUY9_9BACI|nr:ATPase, T2SS/T4P/T4SS family [Halalkalibacter oceani]MCM3716580.1 Flp pilus assembly complex ATPase component TadA [Halalkalibacter oceani]